MFAAAADHDKLQRAALALFERLVGGWSERRQNESAADVLLKLHELDLLDDEKIFAWHERRAELPESGRRERQVSRKGLRACVAPLVEWLKRAAAPPTLHTRTPPSPGCCSRRPPRPPASTPARSTSVASPSPPSSPPPASRRPAPPPRVLGRGRGAAACAPREPAAMPSLDEARAVAVRLVGADPEVRGVQREAQAALRLLRRRRHPRARPRRLRRRRAARRRRRRRRGGGRLDLSSSSSSCSRARSSPTRRSSSSTRS